MGRTSADHIGSRVTRRLFFFQIPVTVRLVPTAVFANLTQLITGRPLPATDGHAFIEAVRVDEREPRDARVERLICWCWVLIAVKHVAIIWAVSQYHVPLHQLWINFPTWLLGVLATAIYYGRTRRE